jgi:hypothetical protein
MDEDHAVYLKYLLQDALARSNEQKPASSKFCDSVDPFSDIRPVQHNDIQAQVIQPLIRALQYEIYLQTRLTATKGQLCLQKIDMKLRHPPNIQRVPNYKHYTQISRCMLVADTRRLELEPYLGDVEDSRSRAARINWIKNLKESYPEQKDYNEPLRIEKVSRVKDYLPRMLQSLNLNQTDLLLLDAEVSLSNTLHMSGRSIRHTISYSI